MSPKILICPLNWGIGHATRCMPIINDLRSKGAQLFIASDGEALKLLQLEYPDIPTYTLPSYSVRYPTKSIVLNLATRVPRILRTIRAEHDTVSKIVAEQKIDVIISDNRFGCHNDDCVSIFITHQVNIVTPNKLLDILIRKINYRHIQNFDSCWIPDFEDFPGLSGHLAHNHGIEAKYIGPLSRMNKIPTTQQYDLSIVLSGPEPQRTKLEQELMEKLRNTNKKVAFVGGNFTDNVPEVTSPNIMYFKLLPSEELNKIYCSSEYVVCRSGYSSMMDLAVLGKKALIIPTPGQTEQEYLADIYNREKWHLKQVQGHVNLDVATEKLKDYTGIPMPQDATSQYDVVIDELIKSKS